MTPLSRRAFLAASAAALAAPRLGAAPPADDPTAKLNLPWTGKLPWGRVLDVTTVPGDGWDARLAKAQEQVAGMGGGVVFFPAGEYAFKETIRLKDGVILRGADPEGATSAHDARYAPPARFEFPKYVPLLSGDGTPLSTAFKGIRLENPGGGAGCGVVNLSINRGHVLLGEAEDHKCGGNRLTVGCLLTNAAVANPKLPDLALGQHPWQRYTDGFISAIELKASENLLVANNRLGKSTDGFVMNGYKLKDRKKGVIALDGVAFDFDNRPGISANSYCVGGPGGEGGGTPEKFPFGFRKGTVVRDNYIFATGRNAIAFTGDGTVCANNVIRFVKDVWRPTNTGTGVTYGSSTNDNRAVQMRGYRWVVEGNDYEVYSNYAADRVFLINDGEGLMHEAHCNSTLKDSRLVNNKGNTYLSIFHTGGVEGLLVEGNEIRVRKDMAIYVVADRHKQARSVCRDVRILGNRTEGGGIVIAGDPATGNVIKGNKHLGGPHNKIDNRADATVEGNEGYAGG